MLSALEHFERCVQSSLAVPATRRSEPQGAVDLAYRNLEKTLAISTPGHATQEHPLSRLVCESFAEATLLMRHLDEVAGCAGGTVPTIDTVGCKTLPMFQLDVFPDTLDPRRLTVALKTALRGSDCRWSVVSRQVRRARTRLDVHRKCLEGLTGAYGIVDAKRSSRQGARRLFDDLFPHLAPHVRRVEFVRVPTLLVFLIDLPDQQRIAKAFGDFPFELLKNFPSFNPIPTHRLPAPARARVAHRSGLPSTTVGHVTPRVVSLLRLDDAEKLVVHDVWGHLWQGILADYSDDFTILATLHRPLVASESTHLVRSGRSRRLSLSEVVRTPRRDQPATWSLDARLARRFFDAEATERLYCGLVLVMSELLADLAEGKLRRRHAAARTLLVSSSQMPQWPAKLDLSLVDLRLIMRRALGPLLDSRLSLDQTSVLEDSLLESLTGHSVDLATRAQRDRVKALMAQLHSIFWERWLNEYQPVVAARSGSRAPGVTGFERLALNLAHIVAAANRVFLWAENRQRVASTRKGPRKVASSSVSPAMLLDLMPLFIARYTQTDRAHTFWDLDENLVGQLVTLWTRLESAMDASPR